MFQTDFDAEGFARRESERANVRMTIEKLLEACTVAEGRLQGLSVVTSEHRRRLIHARLQFVRVLESIDAAAATPTESANRLFASYAERHES